MKLQDEHNNLSLITNQIIKIHNGGGFWTEVMGRHVCVKLWIHLIAGDTSGHNHEWRKSKIYLLWLQMSFWRFVQSHTKLPSYHIRVNQTSTFDQRCLDKIVQEKHIQCIWEVHQKVLLQDEMKWLSRGAGSLCILVDIAWMPAYCSMHKEPHWERRPSSIHWWSINTPVFICHKDVPHNCKHDIT